MTESQSSGACAAADRDMTTKPAAVRNRPNEAAAMASRGGFIRLATVFPVGNRAAKVLTHGSITSSRNEWQGPITTAAGVSHFRRIDWFNRVPM
jgi:hypothetical protein